MSTKPSAWKIFLVLAITCALLSEFFQHVVKKSPQGKIQFAQEEILHLEKKMQESLEIISTFSTDSQFHEYFMHQGLQDKGFSFFYFENGILKYWNDNTIILPENAASEKIHSGSLLSLPDGMYDAFEKSDGNKKIIGLILLHKTYSYENKFLVNHFNPLLELNQDFLVSKNNGDFPLNSSSGAHLLSLNISRAIPDELPFKTPAWFYLFSFIFLFSGVMFYFQKHSAPFPVTLLTGIALFTIRYMMIRFHLPGELLYNDFFSPKVYGSSFFFNSIGDFFLNTLAFFTFCSMMFSYVKNKKNVAQKNFGTLTAMLIVFAGLLFLFYTIHKLISDLVLNSKIIFEPSISDLDINTFVAALSILLLLWGFYLLLSAGISFFKNTVPFYRGFPSFSSGLLVMLMITLYASFVIDTNLEEKKLENQKLFAQRLDSRRDPLAEYLFTDLEKKIVNDALVREIITGNKDVDEKITEQLQQNFFTGYFAKFDVDVSVYDSSGNAYDSSDVNTLNAIRSQLRRGKATASPVLTLLPDESGKLKYLSIIELKDLSATIVVELTARSLQLAEGFPELFVSNTVIRNRDESNYSYARYSNGSLIYAGGNFPYPFHSTAFEKNNSEYSVLSIDNNEHVVYKSSPASCVVVSRPATSFFDSLSLFSYLLLFFLSFYLAAQLFLYLLLRKNKFQLSLKQRIRTSIISLVIASFVLIALGTSVYIVRKYDADKNKTILSRLNAMWFAITDHLGFDSGLSAAGKSQWSAELNNIVSSFNLDFNLYDESGNLFYSSQPKLFEKGILSMRINPEAFYEMRQTGKTQFVHSENIGTLNYAAAYAPFTDHSGNITGYLNLPYFEKQNELNKEISGFISALINIYLLLLVVSLLLALFITSRITKPLLLIQERLSMIRLGSRNEVIDWKRNDEIGQLVQQYNKMVIALAESAERLSRSERESAWREMAQQVAHEIKNPLTPMKLSVQHLQRAWNEKSDNLDELFQRISKTMIEQIDALSNIASEFSNFAKMPKAKNEIHDLDEILKSSINLFNDIPNISISYDRDGVERKIFVDREQLIRAFSNLLKNAIQAIPENKKGLIAVAVQTENDVHHISFSDNGTGIPQALRSKIFTPNFTTKTSGMGLGLAMVKSTITALGGSIRFDTEVGKGSVFYVSIPSA